MMKQIYRFMQKHTMLTLISLIVIVSCGAYSSFITFQHAYLCTTDTAFQLWGNVAHIADYIKTDGFPRWSFSIGLGSPIDLTYVADISKFALGLIGRKNVLHFSFVIHLLKVVLSALFFFMYLRKIKFSNVPCIIGAIYYAFCGIMISRGPWIHYSYEIVLMALLLWALERFFQDSKWLLLVFAVMLLFIHRSLSFVFLYSILLMAYATIRYWLNNEVAGNMPKFGSYLMKCFGIWMIAILISALFVYPSIMQMVSSSRFREISSNTRILDILRETLEIQNLRSVLIAVFRLFSPDMVGQVEEFPINDYLCESVLYSGWLVLILIPQAICLSRRRQRFFFSMSLLATLAYCIFPVVRWVLNMFVSSTYFKLSSLWITVLYICMGVFALDRILKRDGNPPVGIFSTTCIIILATCMFFLLCGNLGIKISKNLMVFAIFIIALYCSLILLVRERSNLSLFILCCICVEVGVVGYFCSQGFRQNSDNIVGLLSQDSTYLVDQYEIYDDIRPAPNTFYRISNAESRNPSLPLFANYYGTMYFDSLINSSNPEIFQLVMETDALDGKPFRSYSRGFENRYMLDTLVGVRYRIDEKDNMPFYGYDIVKSEDRYTLLENRFALPLGFAYDAYITSDTLNEYSSNSMDLMLLSACLLNDKDAKEASGYLRKQEHIEELRAMRQEIVPETEEPIIRNMGLIENNLPERLIFTVLDPADCVFAIAYATHAKDSDYLVEFTLEAEEPGIMSLVWFDGAVWHDRYVDYGVGENNISEHFQNISLVRIGGFFRGENAKYELSNLHVYDVGVNADVLSDRYESFVSDRAKEPFILETFNHNHITGSIDVSGDRMLFFSIAYDDNWTAMLDGHLAEVKKVNGGFLGLFLPKGRHQVVLTYTAPWIRNGLIITIFGLLLMVGLLLVDKRQRIFQMHYLRNNGEG